MSYGWVEVSQPRFLPLCVILIPVIDDESLEILGLWCCGVGGIGSDFCYVNVTIDQGVAGNEL